jgi:hypothetical protein
MAYADFQAAEQARQAAAAAQAKASAAPAAPAAPPPAQTPAATSGQSAPPPPANADPSAPAPGGYDLGPLHFGFTNRGVPGVSWPSGGLGGWLPGSQTLHDVQNRFSNDALGGLADPITAAAGGPDLAMLRMQRQQADQRLTPGEKTATDIAAQFYPTNQFLNRIPVAGPTVQGFVQEGAKSYGAGDDWSTILSNAEKGGAAGAASQLTANVLTRPGIVSRAVSLGFPGLLGTVGLGEHGFLGGYLANKALEPTAEAISKSTSPLWSGARSALQSILMGGASSMKQQGRDNPAGAPLPGSAYFGN